MKIKEVIKDSKFFKIKKRMIIKIVKNISRTFSGGSVGREGAHFVNGGRPSVAETLRAYGSVICLQHPSLPAA